MKVGTINQGNNSLFSQNTIIADNKVTKKESHNSDFLKSENGPEKESKSSSLRGKIVDHVKFLFGLFKKN